MRPSDSGADERAHECIFARSARLLVAALLMLSIAAAPAAVRDAGPVASLRSNVAALQDELDRSPFERPMHLESKQTPDTLRGDIHALIDFPFATVRSALSEAEGWCTILRLHPNVKHCRTLDAGASSGDGSKLAVLVGRMEHRAEFSFRVAADDADYVDVRLDAPTGPMGTHDYRIRLEATPRDANHTIVHLAYSHGFGMAARLAMRAYLGTLGRNKVGFTIVDHDAQGRPVYVKDVRGALERNAMRYYLAIEAYLGALSSPPQEQFEQRLRTFLAANERYPRQLHEEDDYIAIKRREAQRR